MSVVPTFIWSGVVGDEGRTLDLDPSDGGNWTGGAPGVGVLRGSKFGISAARYPNLDIANLTEDAAKALFDGDYYTPLGCHRLPTSLAYLVVDAGYNGGFPIKWMQTAVGVEPDGVFGNITEAAVAARMSAQPLVVLAAFQAERLAYLNSLPEWPHDGASNGRPEGWANRLMTVLAEAVAYGSAAMPAANLTS